MRRPFLTTKIFWIGELCSPLPESRRPRRQCRRNRELELADPQLQGELERADPQLQGELELADPQLQGELERADPQLQGELEFEDP